MDFTEICNQCIWLMEVASDVFHVSYGFINILLFVIFQPAAILFLLLSSVFALKRMKKSAIVFLILGVLPVLLEIIALAITIWAAPAFK